jgi:hypothetical protein
MQNVYHQDIFYLIVKLAFLAQIVYLLSIKRFYLQYFSSSRSSGFILSDKYRWLTCQRVKVIYFVWLTSLVVVFIAPSHAFSKFIGLIPIIFSRLFFVTTRYTSVGRGNGAPGFMSYWVLLYGFFYLLLINHESWVYSIALIQAIDFGLIMLSAGIYKIIAGYLKGEGIEFGLVNPIWSIFNSFWLKFSNNSLVFRILNIASVASEIVIAIFFVNIQTWKYSGLLIILMFVFLGLTVRLGFLSITMIVLGVIFVLLSMAMKEVSVSDLTSINTLTIFFFCILFVFTYIWNWSFKLNKKLPSILAVVVKFSYKISGGIIWSVFTKQLTEIYIDYDSQINDSKISNAKKCPLQISSRGVHNGITVTTLANYSNYFPQNHHENKRRIATYLESAKVFESLSIYRIAKIELGWELQKICVWHKEVR